MHLILFSENVLLVSVIIIHSIPIHIDIKFTQETCGELLGETCGELRMSSLPEEYHKVHVELAPRMIVQSPPAPPWGGLNALLANIW